MSARHYEQITLRLELDRETDADDDALESSIASAVDDVLSGSGYVVHAVSIEDWRNLELTPYDKTRPGGDAT